MNITDELLMAFADGELDEPEAAELQRRIDAEPALAARAAVFGRTRALFAGMPAEPVPDDLAARIRAMAAPSNVVQLQPRRKVPLWQLPAAAAVALAVGLGAGLLVQGDSNVQMAGIDPAVAAMLDRLPSGGRQVLAGGDAVEAIATFRTPEGDLCREFEYDRAGGATVLSVACTASGVWDLRFAVATGEADDAGYVPVSSVDALDAWMAGSEAGLPMSEAEEAEALAGR